MLLPPVYIGVYEGDVEVGSNLFKHWFLRYKAPECMTENQNEPLTQYDYCLETDIENAVKYCGFESLKLDYGWWAGGRPAEVMATPGFWMREGLLKEGTHFLTEMKVLNMKALCDAAKAQGGTVVLEREDKRTECLRRFRKYRVCGVFSEVYGRFLHKERHHDLEKRF